LAHRGSKPLLEKIATNASTYRLVAQHFSGIDPHQFVPGVPVKGERCDLDFGRAKLKPKNVATATLIFGGLEHPSSDAFTSSRGLNIHAPQLHRVVRDALQAERADHLIRPDGYPEAAVALAIIGGDPVNLFDQCALDICLEGIAEIGWAKKPIDRDEQVSDLSGILLDKRANYDACAQVDLPYAAKDDL
jgi:hypothetical protein